MLVLSRKAGQSVCLPEIGVRFEIIRTKQGSTTIGVRAPKSIKVLRGELSDETEVRRGDPVAVKKNFYGCIRAFIIDDDQNELALLSTLLRHVGMEIESAYDGRAALDALQEAKRMPDVVLLDMNMPGMSGRDFIDEIRNNPKLRDLRVFAVSGETSESAGVPIGIGGVDRWFEKPLPTDELLHEIAG